jgi:chromosome segregation ATPase
MADPTESIKATIGNQLQELRSEMLKVDEAVAESRKNQDLNAALNTQLVAEREEAQEMNRKIEALSRQAEDLEEQKVQLERQLAEANDKVRDQNTDKSTLENSTEDLRRQLKLAGDDLSSANAEIERLEKNKKTSDKKIADYDVCNLFISLNIPLIQDRYLFRSRRMHAKNWNKATIRLSCVKKSRKSLCRSSRRRRPATAMISIA